MSALFNGSTQYMQRTGGIVTSLPFTVFFWYKPTATSGVDYCMFCLGRQNDYHAGWSAGQRGQAYWTDRPTAWVDFAGNPAYAGASPTSGWNAAMMVFTNDALRSAAINGGVAGTNTTSDAADGPIQYTTVGRYGPRDADRYFSGRLAWVTVWNKALSAANFTSLYGGAPPNTIEAGNIVDCYDMLRDGYLGSPLVGSDTLTLYNTPTYSSDNPPVIAGHPAVRRNGIWQPRILGVEGVQVV